MTKNRFPRTPLLYLLAGFFGGIIISRNASPLKSPSDGAAFLAYFVGAFILWRAGYKGKSEAVAVAVATATAIANAKAEASAKAMAAQAVSVYIDREQGHSSIGERIVSSLDWDEQEAIDVQQDSSIVHSNGSTKQRARARY